MQTYLEKRDKLSELPEIGNPVCLNKNMLIGKPRGAGDQILSVTVLAPDHKT